MGINKIENCKIPVGFEHDRVLQYLIKDCPKTLDQISNFSSQVFCQCKGWIAEHFTQYTLPFYQSGPKVEAITIRKPATWLTGDSSNRITLFSNSKHDQVHQILENFWSKDNPAADKDIGCWIEMDRDYFGNAFRGKPCVWKFNPELSIEDLIKKQKGHMEIEEFFDEKAPSSQLAFYQIEYRTLALMIGAPLSLGCIYKCYGVCKKIFDRYKSKEKISFDLKKSACIWLGAALLSIGTTAWLCNNQNLYQRIRRF